MRNTRSVILTSRSIDVRVIVILLGPRALHHLIVLIHLILVCRITSTHLLRVWRVPTRILVTHRGRSRHPTGSILWLLAWVSYSPSRVARLLRKPTAACGHQHAPDSLRRVQPSAVIPVLCLEDKLFPHILEQASLLPLLSESLGCLNLIFLFLGILICALTCP